MKRGMLLAVLVGSFLCAPAQARNHRLTMHLARAAIHRYVEDPSNAKDRHWADHCARRSHVKIRCRVHSRNVNMGGDLYDYDERETVTLRHRKVCVSSPLTAAECFRRDSF